MAALDLASTITRVEDAALDTHDVSTDGCEVEEGSE